MPPECGVCLGLNTVEDETQLYYCEAENCTVTVHPGCYDIKRPPIGPWFCDKCRYKAGTEELICCLCPNRNVTSCSPFKRVDDSNWAHAVCALGKSEITMETCFICEDAESKDEFDAALGSCLKCRVKECENYFHVMCAQSKGLLQVDFDSRIDRNGRVKLNSMKFKGFCQEHKSRMDDPPSPVKEGPNSDSEFNESDASQESTMLKSKSSASPWAVQRVAAPSTSSEANVEQKRVQVASSSTSELSDDNDEEMDTDDIICIPLDDEETKSADSFSNQITTSTDVVDENPSSPKKPKLDALTEEQSSSSMDELQILDASCVKRYTKEQLEELVMEQMITIITDKGSIAKLQNTVESYEKELIRVRKTSKELVGQVKKYGAVLQSFILKNAAAANFQPPEKTSRTVGTQINVLSSEMADVRTASRLPAPANAPGNLLLQERRVPDKPAKVPEVVINVPETNVPETASPSPVASKTMPPPPSPLKEPSPSKRVTKKRAEQVVVGDVDSTSEYTIPPLPPVLNEPNPNLKDPPPKPVLQIVKNSTSLQFSWTYPELPESATISYFKIWFHYKLLDGSRSTGRWTCMDREIKARSSPMTCTISSMMENKKFSSKYNFAVQATDIHNRCGPFSDPVLIVYP